MPLGKHCVTIRTRQVASARRLEIIRGDSVKHSEDLNRQLQPHFATTNKTPFSFSALHRPSPAFHQDSFASWQLEAIPCRARLILGTRQNAPGHRNLDRFGRALASSWRFRDCEIARTNHGRPPLQNQMPLHRAAGRTCHGSGACRDATSVYERSDAEPKSRSIGPEPGIRTSVAGLCYRIVFAEDRHLLFSTIL